MARLYGRSPRGERCRAAVPHGHWKTTTFTAGLRSDGLVAPLVLDGPMDGDAFHRCGRGHLRDELLNKASSLDHARGLLTDPQGDYNLIPPHSSIANLPLATYAKLTATDMQRDETLC